LARLEAERVREVREAARRREEAEEAKRREEERAAREAALLHTQKLEEAARKRAEHDEAQRREAMARAVIEQARIEAAIQARVRAEAEEAERAHRHAIELAAARDRSAVALRVRRAVLRVTVVSLAMIGALMAIVVARAIRHDSALTNAIIARDEALRVEHQKSADA